MVLNTFSVTTSFLTYRALPAAVIILIGRCLFNIYSQKQNTKQYCEETNYQKYVDLMNKKQYVDAIHYLSKSSDAGNPEASFELANIFQEGMHKQGNIVVKKSTSVAQALFKIAQESPNANEELMIKASKSLGSLQGLKFQ